MYVSKIELRNIRGFKELAFDLDRGNGNFAGWTVFTGDNGSGKSTLLKAIAIALTGTQTAYALQPSFRHWMRDGAGDEEASIKLIIDRDATDDPCGEPSATTFPAKINLKNGGAETVLQQDSWTVPVNSKSPIVWHEGSNPKDTFWNHDASGWFSCGYGPFRRVFGASLEASRQMVAPATERYVTMFQEAASLFEVDQWLRSLHHKALEQKTSEREQLGLILEILRDDLLPNQISVDRVDSDGLWLKDRNGVPLTWHDMSDGYRSALALLADILRHLIGAYGFAGLTERGSDGKIFIKRSGVVLIDEIDAHLHPEWQRNIGFWLKRHFPNIQFLVTSHSPIICQAADANGLFVLPEPGSGVPPRPLTAGEYQRVVSSRPDTILLSPAFDLQNTRSPRVVEARAELAKLRAKARAGGMLTKSEIAREEELRPLVTNDEEL